MLNSRRQSSMPPDLKRSSNTMTSAASSKNKRRGKMVRGDSRRSSSTVSRKANITKCSLSGNLWGEERTWEPIKEIFRVHQYFLTNYAKEHNLLDEWNSAATPVKKLAKRNTLLTRMLNQAQSWSTTRMPPSTCSDMRYHGIMHKPWRY